MIFNYLLVYQVSSSVDLSQSQFKVIFVIKNIDKVGIEWVNILQYKTQSPWKIIKQKYTSYIHKVLNFTNIKKNPPLYQYRQNCGFQWTCFYVFLLRSPVCYNCSVYARIDFAYT